MSLYFLTVHKKRAEKGIFIRPRPNADFGMHSRDAYPQFADVWVPPGYHIALLGISEYVFLLLRGI